MEGEVRAPQQALTQLFAHHAHSEVPGRNATGQLPGTIRALLHDRGFPGGDPHRNSEEFGGLLGARDFVRGFTSNLDRTHRVILMM